MTPRTQLRRHAERAVPQEAADILSQGYVAHIGFSIEGQPFVIPFAYHYDPATPTSLYLHGAPASRTVRHLAKGAPVCVTVTLLDGLVYSRSAKDHSMNYRSVVCFGHARLLKDTGEKAALFERMTQRYFPGRTAGSDYDAALPPDLRSADLVEVQIEEWSGKARRGGPKGSKDALPDDAPGTRGVIELREPS